MALQPTTILQRVANFRVTGLANDTLEIGLANGLVLRDTGRFALSILETFAQPISLETGLAQLEKRVVGAQDWMDLMATVMHFHQVGVLRSPQSEAPQLNAVYGLGYDAAPVHVAMLNDRQRTGRYLEAITEVVGPEDVVVDVGTGTGVLALAAARAGARHVYAIEASDIGPIAQQMFAANGYADRMTLVRGWSTQVTLPERATVLVSEMLGNEPLGEAVLEMTLDARKRFLTPTARFVPQEISVWALPLALPEERWQSFTFAPQTVRNWNDWYGLDFGSLAETLQQPQKVMINPHKVQGWTALTAPMQLLSVDLATWSELRVDVAATAPVVATGRLNAILIYFELQLSPKVRFSLHPSVADADNHWRNPLWILPQNRPVTPDQTVIVRYRYGVAGSEVNCSVS